jgi:hypothetical protein
MDLMQRRALLFALIPAVSLTACMQDHPSRPEAAGARTAATNRGSASNNGTVPVRAAPAGKEVVYRSVRLVIPADWTVRNEHTPCPALNETGLFIVEPAADTASCDGSSPPSDGVRIGPLVGYPPTRDGVAPVIGGETLAKVDLRGGVGYRTSRGPDPHSFWVLLPKPSVQLLFTYASDVKTAESILASVSID